MAERGVIMVRPHAMGVSPDERRFCIVVSGGPAPGINSAIASTVIEASRHGHTTYGIIDGFEGAVKHPDAAPDTAESSPFEHLTIDAVVRIARHGGSILRTSRFNPFASDDDARVFLARCATRKITDVVVIGGEGSAFLSRQLALRAPHLAVAHIPKTIDNDLPLPEQYPSFGFETARYVGTEILHTLMEDARTTRRWFIVTTMGRRAGFLALGLGIASSATMTFIPEEYPNGTTPQAIAREIAASITLRASQGRRHGVVLIAEGVLDKLIEGPDDPVQELRGVPRDPLGRIRYSEVSLESMVSDRVAACVRTSGLSVNLTGKDIGYELRCADPVSFDLEYTRVLGWGAVRALLEGHRSFIISRGIDRVRPLPFDHVFSESGTIESRTVDLSSDLYRAARSFMIRGGGTI